MLIVVDAVQNPISDGFMSPSQNPDLLIKFDMQLFNEVIGRSSRLSPIPPVSNGAVIGRH